MAVITILGLHKMCDKISQTQATQEGQSHCSSKYLQKLALSSILTAQDVAHRRTKLVLFVQVLLF